MVGTGLVAPVLPEIRLNNIKNFSFYPTENALSIIKTTCFTLFREIVDVYCENHMKYLRTPCRQNAEFFKYESRCYVWLSLCWSCTFVDIS
jgi:hypothetical protein